MNEENSLWMGDISPEMDEPQILASFQFYNFYPTKIKFIKDKKTNSKKNYCFVFFKNNEETSKALNQLNGKIIPNTNFSFKLNTASYHSPINRTIYVGNLNKSINDDMLLNFFQMKYSSANKATIIKEKNISKGYGFVVFNKENEYKNCLVEMDGVLFQGKNIIVREQKRKDDEDNNGGFNNNNHNINDNNNILLLNKLVNNNINKEIIMNFILRNNINEPNTLNNINNIINKNRIINNEMQNNINNINNFINNSKIININNNILNQNNNILNIFNAETNNNININNVNKIDRRITNNKFFDYNKNKSIENKNIDLSKILLMNDNKMNNININANNNVLNILNKNLISSHDIKNNPVNFFNNSYNNTIITNNNQNDLNDINKLNKKLNIVNNINNNINNNTNSIIYNKNFKKHNKPIKLEILEKIDEHTLIKKIRESINNTFYQYKKLYSMNGSNIKSKYLLLLIYILIL